MALQVGSKGAGRSVLLRFLLYPAVENIPGEIIFYRGLPTHLPYKRLKTEKSLFYPQGSQTLETDFSLLQ
jgi:hypothetical protein